MKIPFSKLTIGKEEIDAVSQVLKSGWIAPGKQVELFEKEFAKFAGAKYAIFTNSGTSALKMAYKYFKELGYTHYSYPSNTFCATYASAEEMGLKRANKFVSQSKVIPVNVHYGGVLDDTKPCLIEDSAHRIEPKDPLIGKIRCYSFYASKNMTSGSGGMLVTNEKKIYLRTRLFWQDGLTAPSSKRLTGKIYNYQVKVMSGGYDGNDIAASIARVQLKKLPKFIKKRNAIVARYNKAFNQNWEGNYIYPYFVKTLADVSKFINYMKKNGISCGYHYPNTGWLGVSLPIFPLLTKKEVDYIIDTVNNFRSK